MSKTILIGINNRFSVNANKWLYYSLGLLFLFNGVFHIFSNSFKPIGIILGILMIIGGMWYIIYGFTAFSVSSKYAPRVRIDDTEIELKNNFFKPATQINWTDVKKIEFDLYKLSFQLSDNNLVFSYNTYPDISIDIKRMIREMAEEKNIEVIGG